MARVAVIGTGRIGAMFEADKLRAKPCTHLGAWKQLVGNSNVIVAELNPERLEIVRNEFGVEGVFDYKDLPGTYDVVSVATRLEGHYPIVMDLVKDNKAKVIFCEKPLASSLTEARDMVQYCREKGVVLAVNHSRRWETSWGNVSQWVRSGSMGALVGASGYFSGDIVDTGSHMADLCNWFGLEGPTTHIVNMKEVEYLIFELEIFFSRGRIRVTDNGRTLQTFVAESSTLYEYFNELREMPKMNYTGGETPILRACRQLLQVAKEGGVPSCTGEDGLKALERALAWKNASLKVEAPAYE